MKHCIFVNCKNVDTPSSAITFFCLPDDERRLTWITASGNHVLRFEPEQKQLQLVVCEKHFANPFLLLKQVCRKKLCRHAVPTPWYEDYSGSELPKNDSYAVMEPPDRSESKTPVKEDHKIDNHSSSFPAKRLCRSCCLTGKEEVQKPEIPMTGADNTEDNYFAVALVDCLNKLNPMKKAMAKFSIVKYLTELEYSDKAILKGS